MKNSNQLTIIISKKFKCCDINQVNSLQGGAGMVFSRVAVSQIVGGGKSCECGQPDSPDDMEIGVWATHLGLSITHSDQMHQV